MRIISAYAPQVAEEKSSFYEDLEQYVHSIEDEEVLLLGGDPNGHIGEQREGFDRWHGGYGYGTRNEEGQRILKFAAMSDLVIANTQFRKSGHFHNRGRETQIDFWMLRRRDRNILVDTKAEDRQRIKWWKLKERKDKALPALLSCLTSSTECTVGEQWNATVNAIKDSATGFLRRTSPGKTKIEKATWWWNEEVQAAIAQQKSEYKRWMRTHRVEDRDA
ncbi:hypothetical protein Y032_0005g2339 [Ancylostoma ceylanicum]|uniref:Endonuclease/exonuclease/phosphatase domain-containing protein n=1 Tax=Ancylostoma ceylanicum TaxID=53326 RepID=A0A016VT37_9BILA|nr:hypothetical protein Y032_0005g2339 [Ancylostoma ceylanicum]